ncbi:MAG: hypothetical protein H7067_01670 [Burkholderiales bacterium]|nr:hypothetical protein [Opitutaceae bacterium]
MHLPIHASVPRRRRPARTAGFTLVEVMMASLVMVLAITSAILVIQSGFKALDTARNTTLASQIMQSEMERIRLLSWSDIVAMPEKGNVNLANIFPRDTAEQRKVYEAIIQTFVPTPTFETTYLEGNDNQVRVITVNVSWEGLDGVRRNRSSFTQYCKDGLYAYYYTRAR